MVGAEPQWVWLRLTVEFQRSSAQAGEGHSCRLSPWRREGGETHLGEESCQGVGRHQRLQERAESARSSAG